MSWSPRPQSLFLFLTDGLREFPSDSIFEPFCLDNDMFEFTCFTHSSALSLSFSPVLSLESRRARWAGPA